MLKHWMVIVHNHGNGYLDWLFHQNVFPMKESTSIMYACPSILLATFNYRARGTCGPSTLNYSLNGASNA